MIIVRLKGGLGNQLFQYAFGRSVANQHDVELGLDTYAYDDPAYINGNTPRTYKLDVFNIKAKIIPTEEAKKFYTIPKKIMQRVRMLLFPENSLAFNPKYKKCRDGSYHIGFWQSEKYFLDIKEKIQAELTLNEPLEQKTALKEQQIKSCKISVSLSIRRTDYLNDPMFQKAVCTPEYYSRAIKYIADKSGVDEKDLNIFITADDIDWAKSNIKSAGKINFISYPGTKDYEEMTLISKCTHHIIANSTFSWWGAWLDSSPNKIVVAPILWADPKIPTPDIIPESWIQL